MAIFRKVHTSIWSDSFFSELSKEHKLFYLYLLTNERTKQCGIYEITKRQIAFDLGYSIDKVSVLLKYFSKVGKIQYNVDTCEIALRNWAKYNGSTSPKVQLCIDKELKEIKDKALIQYLYSIDIPSQEEQEEEQEEEEEPKKEFSDEIKNFTASLSKLFPENITTKLTDSQKRNWIDTVDKLIRIDKFTKQQIEKAIKVGRKDEFWSKQFLSLNKLRKLNKDDIKYINVFLNLNGHQQERNPPELKQITLRDDDRN